jgi:hypothetical protein
MQFLIVLVSELVNPYKCCANIVDFCLPEKKRGISCAKTRSIPSKWRKNEAGGHLQKVPIQKAIPVNNNMLAYGNNYKCNKYRI